MSKRANKITSPTETVHTNTMGDAVIRHFEFPPVLQSEAGSKMAAAGVSEVEWMGQRERERGKWRNSGEGGTLSFSFCYLFQSQSVIPNQTQTPWQLGRQPSFIALSVSMTTLYSTILPPHWSQSKRRVTRTEGSSFKVSETRLF